MKNHVSIILFMLILIACSSNPQRLNGESSLKYSDSDNYMDLKGQNVSLYPYDTLLKGGFVLAFRSDNDNYFLFLKKDSLIKEISSCSKGLPYKNLGYKAADFIDHFVLAQSFGSGNPHFIQLIRKKDGENLIKTDAVWIGAEEEKELLVYAIYGDTSNNETIVVLDLSTNKNQIFSLPDQMHVTPGWYNEIKIHALTVGEMIIKYNNGKEELSSTFRW